MLILILYVHVHVDVGERLLLVSQYRCGTDEEKRMVPQNHAEPCQCVTLSGVRKGGGGDLMEPYWLSRIN